MIGSQWWRPTVPPLRERREDVPLLVERALAEQHRARSWLDLPANSLEMLTAHRWPGNVRELREVVSRLLRLPSSPGSVDAGIADAPRRGTRLPLQEAREAVVEQFERGYLAARLSEVGGDVSKAAEAMEISRLLLQRLVERYGLKDAREACIEKDG